MRNPQNSTIAPLMPFKLFSLDKFD
jgi:hypothetical protein